LLSVVSLLLSFIAILFSIYVFLVGRRRDRRDMFLKIHESLISDDLQRGRQLLFTKVKDESSVDLLTDQEYRDINRALGTYNLLGLYVRNGYVDEADVMESWAEPLYNAWRAAGPFIEHREHNHGFRPYAHFEALAKKAEATLVRKTGVSAASPADVQS
jgi:hypothetical protein